MLWNALWTFSHKLIISLCSLLSGWLPFRSAAAASSSTKMTDPQPPQEPPPKVVEQTVEQELFLEEPKSVIPSWRKASLERLKDAEKRLLSKVTGAISQRFVNVRFCNGQIHTITAKETADSPVHPVPFVLVHGFAAGVAIWKSNLGALAQKRTTYAFDLLGFGQSSRPRFNSDATLAELEFVQSIEDWRKAMGIEKMILVGHSFGAFLASSYTLEHPSRVRHLVLVDPWGFSERPHTDQLQIPIWMRAVGSVLSRFNALSALRLAGPLGPILVRKLRSDLGVRYSHDDPEAIYEYVYQCNAREPTGEEAFRTLTKAFGWPRRPMRHRFSGIDPKIPVTFICGSKSWINSEPIFEIQSGRANSYVDVKIVNGAGHHVYADQPEKFNEILRKVSDLVDEREDLHSNSRTDDSTTY